MPRVLRPPKGKLGEVLAAALDACELTPQQAAAAAGVHKGTLYKLLAGETRTPHHSTLRKLCKVLRLDIAKLIGAEQLELLETGLEDSGVLSAIEELLVLEFRAVPPSEARRALELALLAMLDVNLGTGQAASTTLLDQAAEIEINAAAGAEGLLIKQLRTIPRMARPAAVRAAFAAMLDHRMVRGTAVSAEVVAGIEHLKHRVWRSVEPPKRKHRGSTAPRNARKAG